MIASSMVSDLVRPAGRICSGAFGRCGAPATAPVDQGGYLFWFCPRCAIAEKRRPHAR